MTSTPVAGWQPPSPEELQQELPQYEITKMLGRGGMGAVYMGRQTSLDRPVAIKILSGALEESDAGFTERFKNEARAMAKLNHPGIVSVYDFGETASGLLYIVMEYVDGTDVSKMIVASGRLHTEHAMAITAHVCDALSYAHERGIIHRDIKPANIMVAYDGSVKVADFGLAKVSTAHGSTMGLTQSGMALGTLHYMAPEALILGAAVDHRADVYAVGVMLYQMLTGKVPQGMFKMPSQLVPGLDPRYDAVIRQAIMEDRDERYASIRDMRSALDNLLTQPVQKIAESAQPALPTQARPQRPGGRPPQAPKSRAVPQEQPQAAASRSFAWLWLLLIAGGSTAAWFFLSPKATPVTTVPEQAVEAKPAVESPKVTPPPAPAAPAISTTTVTSSAPAPAPAPASTTALWEIPFTQETYLNPGRQDALAAMQWVETDGSKGSFVWEFADPRLRIPGLKIESAWLFFKTADLSLAPTKDRITVHSEGKVIGSQTGASGNTWIGIELDKTALPVTAPFFVLTLRCGKDGLGVLSERSTERAYLRVRVSLPADAVIPPDPDGWISLFNGKDLSGWELRPAGFPAKVENGLLRLDGSERIETSGKMYWRGSGADLPVFTDFEVMATVKTERKGNSGIFLHSHPVRGNGVEVQIWNDSSKGTKGHTGSLQRISPLLSSRFRDGDWIQVKARVEGKRVQTWLKKPEEPEWIPAIDWTQPDNWVPPSDRPDIKLGSGTLALQNNPPLDGVVWYREILFRELKPAPVQPQAGGTMSVADLLGLWTTTNTAGQSGTFEFRSDGTMVRQPDGAVVRWKITGTHVTWDQKPKNPVYTITADKRLQGTTSQGDFLTGVRVRPDSTASIPTLPESFGGHRYVFVPGFVTWQEAHAKAQQMGGHLAKVESPAEHAWIVQTYVACLAPGEMFFIGGGQSRPNVPWTWVTGETVGQGHWTKGEPNNATSKGPMSTPPFYLAYHKTSSEVGWNDLSESDARWKSSLKGFLIESDTETSSSSAPAATASATLWIDNKGRSLQATFVRLEGEVVQLRIAGKTTPISLATLSSASQQIARNLARQSMPDAMRWLLGGWAVFYDPQITGELNRPAGFLSDGTACYSPKQGVYHTAQWRLDNEQLVIEWDKTTKWVFPVPGLRQPEKLVGNIVQGNNQHAIVLAPRGDQGKPRSALPRREELLGKDFGFFSRAVGRSQNRPDMRLETDGSIRLGDAGNESTWEYEDGFLVFRSSDGRPTSIYHKFILRDGRWNCFGPCMELSDTENILSQK